MDLTQEVKGWFLTYPKCPLSPQQALALLENLPIHQEFKEYVICQEPHEDGSPHLHAFLKYKTKVQFGPRRWDIDSYHGHYEPAQSWRAVEKYCKKGGNYISNFDLNAAASKKASGRSLNKRILEEDLLDLVDEGEVHVKDYIRLKLNKTAIIRDKLPLLSRCVGYIPNGLGKILPVLEGKQRHYWIWSDQPNTGKTTFLKSVAAAFPSYWLSYRETFQACHPGTQFVLLDEYSSPHLPATQLNQMCDGTWQYPYKGGEPVQLQDPIILVGSNKPPEEVYPNVHKLITARFVVVSLNPS